MKLSIILRTWNRLEYTMRTLLSIERNCGINKNFYEIIIVDMGSTDGTREWLKSIVNDRYYPVYPIFMEKNVGDGLGMEEGIKYATGDYIAQLDSDIKLITPGYFHKLICIYEQLEKFGIKVCAIGGSHRQGIEKNSAPMRFGRKRYSQGFDDFLITFTLPHRKKDIRLFYSAWITAAFIFRKEFTSCPFGKGMTNSWCGYWWDKGYNNFLCEDIKFWHLDSGATGAHVQLQHNKFPSYDYVFRHYSNFIKRKK